MARNKQMMEVRCCCRPATLLGWLPLPRDWTGQPTVEYHWPTIAWPPRSLSELNKPEITQNRVCLEVQAWSSRSGARGIALKPDGLDLFDLVKIPGFHPNHDNLEIMRVVVDVETNPA